MGRPSNVSVLTAGMIKSFLEHLELNKGDEGLYMTNRNEAYAQACEYIKARHPQYPVEISSIISKVNILASSRYMRKSSQAYIFTLFRNGIAELPQKFLSDIHSDFQGRGYVKQTENPSQSTRQTRTKSKGSQTQPSKTPTVDMSDRAQEPGTPPTPSVEPLSSFSSPQNSVRTTNGVLSANNVYTNMTTNQRDRHRIIDNYLIQDQDAFSCGTEKLRQIQSDILRTIEVAVQHLVQSDLDPVNPRMESSISSNLGNHPKLSKALRTPDFQEICKKMFRAHTATGVYDLASTTTFLVQDLLRALVAAAMHIWVLDNGRVHAFILDQLEKKPQISKLFEQNIAKICPELYEQAKAESRFNLIDQYLNLGTIPEQLVNNFNDAISVFLWENELFGRYQRCPEWKQKLRSAFEEAIKLKAWVVLRNQKEFFDFPMFNTPFDPASMRVDGLLVAEEGNRVQLAFFPALREHAPLDKQKDPDDLIVLLGVVTLQ